VEQDIVGAHNGCIDNYGYMLMALHFLVKQKVAPNLQMLGRAFGADHYFVHAQERGSGIDQCETSFYEDVERLPQSSCTDNACELFRRFVTYYSAFDWEKDSACLRLCTANGRETPKCDLFQREGKSHDWFIEDPFDLKHNLAGNSTEIGRKHILTAFRTASQCGVIKGAMIGEEEPEYVIHIGSTRDRRSMDRKIHEPINGVTMSRPLIGVNTPAVVDWNQMWNWDTGSAWAGHSGHEWGHDNNAYKKETNESFKKTTTEEWGKGINRRWGEKENREKNENRTWNKCGDEKRSYRTTNTNRWNSRCWSPHEQHWTVEEKGWNGHGTLKAHAQENILPKPERSGSRTGEEAEWKQKENQEIMETGTWNKHGNEKRSYAANTNRWESNSNSNSNSNWTANWTHSSKVFPSNRTSNWTSIAKGWENRKEEDEKEEVKWNRWDWWKSKRREGLWC